MGVSQHYGYLLGDPYNKDYSILGSLLGSPNFGKLPYRFTWGYIGLHRLIRVLGWRVRGFKDLDC